MARKYKRLLRLFFEFLLMACALVVIAYYWMHADVRSMRELPVHVMTSLMLYLLVQVFRRRFFQDAHTTDNLYYIGLLTVILPVFLVSDSNRIFFNWLTDIGSLFLVMPILVRTIRLIRKSDHVQENKTL